MLRYFSSARCSASSTRLRSVILRATQITQLSGNGEMLAVNQISLGLGRGE